MSSIHSHLDYNWLHLIVIGMFYCSDKLLFRFTRITTVRILKKHTSKAGMQIAIKAQMFFLSIYIFDLS